MSLWKEIRFINELLSHLFERTERDFHENGGLWRGERTSWLCEILTPLNDTYALERVLPSKTRTAGRLSDERKLLYLEPVEKGSLLPILDMRWNLIDPKSPELRFRFFLLHWPAEDPETKPHVVGFRLETSEGRGSHDYYHAQMIKGFEKGDDLLRELLRKNEPEDLTPWVPISQPAFPLPAHGPADLLVVLLVSIYGLNQLAELGVDSRSRQELRRRLGRMKIIQSPCQ